MSEVPKPPRKVQAPKVRQHERRPAEGADAARQRKILYALGGSGFLALAIVLAVVLLGGGKGGGDANAADAKSALEAAGCTFKSVKALPAGNHLTGPDAPVKPAYNTFPPTSGPHLQTPAPWGIYEEPVDSKILVHNLEHGGIVVEYGKDVPEATSAELRSFFEDSPNGIVGAPFPALGKKISLGAWTAPEIAAGEDPKPGTAYLATCTAYDAKGFDAFRDAFRYHGPERIPADLMQPGQ